MAKNNNKYAVIRLKGTQHIVSEDDELLVDKIGKKSIDPEVLMVSDGKKIKLGKPVLKKAKVKIKILEDDIKGKKLKVAKFKAKSRYRRRYGFRPRLSKIKVEKITA